MLAGGTHIDHVNMLRAGATGRVLGFKVMAPLHGRNVSAVLHVRSYPPTGCCGVQSHGQGLATRRWARDRPVVIDLDSTICEVHGKAKQGAAYGYTKRLGYHPLLATLAGTGEILFARMRKGSAGSSRGGGALR